VFVAPTSSAAVGSFRIGNFGIAPGSDSLFLMVDTDAKAYAQNALYDLTNLGQNPISQSFQAFGPAAVPVPAALPLLLTGLAALGGWQRKQKAA
jgi:hypothetical protein